MHKPILVAGLLALAAGWTGAARAHEFVVAPTTAEVAPGAPLEVAAYSTHTLLAPEELEATEINRVTLVQGGRATPVAISADESRLLQIGRATAPAAGSFLLAGHRLPLVFSTTPRGSRPGGRTENPDATRVNRMEKFSKSLVNLAAGDAGFAAVVGHRLEIVPLANPAELRVGDELPIRVLFENQPLGTAVFATFQGFSEHPNTYGFYTEAAADGTARVRLTSPGLWVVRVENRRMLRGDPALDMDAARATLVFRVR